MKVKKRRGNYFFKLDFHFPVNTPTFPNEPKRFRIFYAAIREHRAVPGVRARTRLWLSSHIPARAPPAQGEIPASSSALGAQNSRRRERAGAAEISPSFGGRGAQLRERIGTGGDNSARTGQREHPRGCRERSPTRDVHKPRRRR